MDQTSNPAGESSFELLFSAEAIIIFAKYILEKQDIYIFRNISS